MKPLELNKLFESFNRLNVLIIGDVMLDSYYWGNVSRISPEAPVPIVAVNRTGSRLGGAGNVVINIQALGASPYLCGVAGTDDNGDLLIQILKAKKLTVDGIVRVKNRPTTTKTRIISHTHHLIRIDEEEDKPIEEADSEKLFLRIKKFVESGKIDVIIFEDYDKGVISARLIKEVTRLAKQENIPIAVDPKKRNFSEYHHVTLFKPNLKELREGLNSNAGPRDIGNLNVAVEKLRKTQDIDIALVTLSELGVYVNSDKVKKIIPAVIRNISDVSGAGDSVISVAALCCALKLSPVDTAILSNLAGGQVCEKSGVAPVNKKQLLEEAVQYLNHKP
jgi:D-glycero-beta-D-manno-heptose-7-phosphate kinase